MHTTSTRVLSQGLQKRTYQRLSLYSDEEIFLYLADTIYQERTRFEKGQAKDASIHYRSLLESASKSLKRNRESMMAALMNLVDDYAKEIHTHFSNRTYSLAEKIIPGAYGGGFGGYTRNMKAYLSHFKSDYFEMYPTI